MIIVPVKEGENIERALKKFKRSLRESLRRLVSLRSFALASSSTSLLYLSASRWSTQSMYSSCVRTKNNLKFVKLFCGLNFNQ